MRSVDSNGWWVPESEEGETVKYYSHCPERPQDASEELGNAEGSPYTDTSVVEQVNRAIRDVCEAIDRGPEAEEHWEEYQAEQKCSEGE